MNHHRPRLRPLDIRPFVQDGQELLLLRDPLALADRSVVIPAAAAPILALCDGTRNADEMRTALFAHFGVQVAPEGLAGLLAALDQTYLLDNERTAEARARVLDAYRSAPFRGPALAGGAYPAEPAALAAYLDAQVAEGRARYPGTAVRPAADVRGLVSPHIDYERGGPVYGAVWDRATSAANAADVAIIFGTDHSGGHGKLTLTRQHYATPFGVLPTATAIVDACAAAVSAPFEEELHHRNEHSIELAAVWLHHLRGGRPCEIVPVLCGSFGHFVAGQADPATDPDIAGLVAALKAASEGRRVLVIAAADMAHIGPAFGGEPVDAAGTAALRDADAALLERMAAGDAAGFFAALREVGDRNNVCGLPPVYLALRLLARAGGITLAYDQCPADDHGTSFVSVAGLVWA
jgi:MEMO1 family protein